MTSREFASSGDDDETWPGAAEIRQLRRDVFIQYLAELERSGGGPPSQEVMDARIAERLEDLRVIGHAAYRRILLMVDEWCKDETI